MLGNLGDVDKAVSHQDVNYKLHSAAGKDIIVHHNQVNLGQFHSIRGTILPSSGNRWNRAYHHALGGSTRKSTGPFTLAT